MNTCGVSAATGCIGHLLGNQITKPMVRGGPTLISLLIFIYIYKIYTYKFFVSFFKILCKSQFEQQEQKLQKTSRLSGMETIRVVLGCDV